MTSLIPRPDPARDLLLERIVPLPPERIWTAWTTPEHLMPWFTPTPWNTDACEIDLHPGGIFRTVMRSPEGQEFPNIGCYLEIVPNKKLVWTNALLPGFRPASPVVGEVADCGLFLFTAHLFLTPHEQGTNYTALVIHKDAEGKQQHEAMGFHEGWGKALDQLVAYMGRR